MIYLITDNKIITHESLSELNEEEKLLVEDIELKSIGTDYVAILTAKDLDFVRDKYNLSKIPMQRLFNLNNFNYRKEKPKNKKLDKTTLMLFSVTIGLLLINIIMGVLK